MRMNVVTREVHTAEDLEKLRSDLLDAEVIVDAIFGIGFRGLVSGVYARALQFMNESKGLKVAIDVPSGVNADTGDVGGIAFKADLTVTFHRIKRGLIKAKEYVGELIVKDIGIPEEAGYIVGLEDVARCFRPRRPFSKKGDHGRVLILGGSIEYTGAPTLSALACLKMGIDIAIVASPKSVTNIIRGFDPCIIARPLPDEEYLSPKSLKIAYELAKRADVIVLGPGLGLRDETFEFVREFIKSVDKPMVVDADALKALREHMKEITGKELVLTPHAGEFRIMTGIELPSPENLCGRVKIVEEVAKKYDVTILLKGREDVISNGRRTRINMTGNASMTAGGTGDVLTGVVASLIAMGNNPFDAACAGAFINGLAGDLAVKRQGLITARDLIEYLQEALKIVKDPRSLVELSHVAKVMIGD